MAIRNLKSVLLSRRADLVTDDPSYGWPFLRLRRRKPLTRSIANQYLFFCQLEFQMPAGGAVVTTERFSRDILGGGNAIWQKIAAYTEAEWTRLAKREKLHRFAEKTGRAVWLVSHRMIEHFGGDARNVWKSGDHVEALHNLTKVLRIGPQLSRMCVLGLLEGRYLKGNGDVKADVTLQPSPTR